MEKQERILRLWCFANTKRIPIEVFNEAAGMSFEQFLKENKKECSVEWRKYLKDSRNVKKLEKEMLNGCICEIERNKPANTVKGTEKTLVRLFKCPKHGNVFVDK